VDLVVVQGSSNRPLAKAVAEALAVRPANCHVETFPDGEMQVEVLDNARGGDVYIVQGTHPPVGENLMELLLIADAYRRAGAARLTAVIPYFGYARQDRRRHGRESLGARLVADLLSSTGINRVVAVDLHTPAIEGCFAEPVENLTAIPLLADRIRSSLPEGAVVVSPDLGAVKLAERLAERLGLPMAVVHKIRTSGANVKAQGVVGDVKGKAPILVDDMVTTAGTVEAAARAVLDQGARPEVTVVATHGLLVGPAAERLRALPIQRVVVTDSVPGHDGKFPVPVERCSLAPLLAETVRRLHSERPISDLLANT